MLSSGIHTIDENYYLFNLFLQKLFLRDGYYNRIYEDLKVPVFGFSSVTASAGELAVINSNSINCRKMLLNSFRYKFRRDWHLHLRH